MNQDTEDLEFEPAPPDKLYAHNRRQLSAMLDGELSPDQARFMLRRLQHDSELAECWERWQVCGDVLRGHGNALLPADFSRRVAAAIAAPDAGPSRSVLQAGNRVPRARMLRWGGGALAASMALVALFMARQLPDAQPPAAAGDTVAAASIGVDARAGEAEVMLAAAAAGSAEVPEAAAQGGTVAPAPARPDERGGALAVASGVAVAALPRGAGERRSRGQSQRAARRVAAASASSRTAVAAAPATVMSRAGVANASLPAVESIPLLADLPDARGFGATADAPFGALPVAPSRPWPRAVLPGLSGGSQPFSAGYGLPSVHSDPAFAPFQPRLVEAAPARADVGADARDGRPGPGYHAD